LLLRSKLGVDPVLNPNLYTIAIFIAQTLELGIKLPLETILRRGQIEVAFAGSESKRLQTVVEVGPYRGLFGTVRSVVYEEGDREDQGDPERPVSDAKGFRVVKSAQQRQRRKGQGLEGLWRGWRVGMWGILGVWGAATLGGVGGKGGEF
jgi:fusion and transport protein UGO1